VSVPTAQRRQDPTTDEAFERLVRAHHARVRAYLLRRAPELADDAVSEVFLVAWRRSAQIPRGREEAWLYGVARRVLANAERGDRRFRAALERAAAERPTSDEPVDPVLVEAFDRLRAGQREVLFLTYWEGLDGADVAEALGCSRAAAAVRLHRARAALRRVLEREEGSR
jgi:RNA polymerase sigma factor (sigma-70 family)